MAPRFGWMADIPGFSDLSFGFDDWERSRTESSDFPIYGPTGGDEFGYGDSIVRNSDENVSEEREFSSNRY